MTAAFMAVICSIAFQKRWDPHKIQSMIWIAGSMAAVCCQFVLVRLIEKGRSQGEWVKSARQMVALGMMGLLLGGILLAALYRSNVVKQLSIVLMTLCIPGVSLATTVIWSIFLRKAGFRMNGKVLRGMREHAGICVIIAVLALSCTGILDTFQRWDASQYLLYMLDKDYWCLFSVEGLSLCGHPCLSYSAGAVIIQCFVGDSARALVMMNVFLFLASVAAFYGIVRRLSVNKSKWLVWGGTLIYALSPYLYGVVTSTTIDYPLLCLYVVMAYCLVSDNKIFLFFAALLFVFTKEPAIVILNGFFAGVVLYELLESGEKGIFRRIGKIFRLQAWSIWIPAVIDVIWLVFYFTPVREAWKWGSQENSYGNFGFKWSYVADRIKMMFGLNWIWFFAFLGIIGICVCIKRRAGEERRYRLPLLLGVIASLLFNCLFITGNVPRYNGPFFIVLYLYCVILFGYIRQGWLRYGLTGACILLNLASCFYTFDPVSRSIYPMIDVGNQMIAGTDLWDEIVYNRQYTGLDKVIDEAIALVRDEGEDCVICWPADGTASIYWRLSGVWNEWEEVRWDPVSRGRTRESGADTQTLDMLYLKDDTWDMLDSIEQKEFYYLAIDACPIAYEEKLTEEFELLGQREIVIDGWRAVIYHFGI